MRKTSVAAPLFSGTVQHLTAPINPTPPTFGTVLVTPALAKEWLNRNTHNRKVRARAVFDYARDMAAGNWKHNGEAIKFSRSGALLDGQHRLLAIVESGVAVELLVVNDLDDDAQETMDSGRRRTTGDALNLRGETNFTVLAAILKKVWQWDQGDHRFNSNISPTTAECAQLLADRPELRRSAEIASRIQGAFPYLPQSITGTAHHIFSRIDLGEATWFFQRLADGAELPLTHPILTLRNRALTDRANGQNRNPDRTMAYLIRTWNAVREGRDLTRIIQPADAPMPMPK
jgi:hypothetical protein